MITTVIGIASAVGVAVSGRWLTRNGCAQIRWWAVPLFCILGLVGMPMTISFWTYPTICTAAGGVYLAPWLIGYCVYDFSKAEISSPSASWGTDKSR
jgi:hypothetical protein